MNTSGRFITFEGSEGVGKSTNIAFCAQWLAKQGIDAIVTREPGGTLIAETIRHQLLNAKHPEEMDSLTELLLMFAARAQHIAHRIRPALAAGKWVLCDRFTDSTIAYQGFGRELSLDVINQLKTLVQQDLEPDCTFLLDAPLTVGWARVQKRDEPINRFEEEEQAFFERVQNGFHWLAEQNPRIQIIDAAQPLESVQQDIIEKLQELTHG